MKKLFLVIGLATIATIGFGQEIVKRSDLYQDPTTNLLSQFVIEVEGKTTAELKNSVELWAASIFNNPDHVNVAEGENYILYKHLTTFFYDIGMGMNSESKMTCHTKFEFKDGAVRVTITELESIYITDQGPVSMTTWPSTIGGRQVPPETPNKGLWKASYRRYTQAIQEKESWVSEIKNINFIPLAKSNW